MDLVTVTCALDLPAVILQAHSIDQFVTNPVTHWIILEDDVLPSEQWQQDLAPFYTRHNLKLINNIALTQDLPGWQRQQILKFMIAEHITVHDYLILDSKNFFIKSTNLDQWPIAEGCHDVTDTPPGCLFHPWMEYLTHNYNLPVYKHHWNSITPYRVKTETVKHILKLNLPEMFKNSPSTWISEFLLYSRFVNQQNITPGTKVANFYFNSQEMPTIDQLEAIRHDLDLVMLSVHRSAIFGNPNMAQDFNKLILMRDFLISVNLNRSIINTALVKNQSLFS